MYCNKLLNLKEYIYIHISIKDLVHGIFEQMIIYASNDRGPTRTTVKNKKGEGLTFERCGTAAINGHINTSI